MTFGVNVETKFSMGDKLVFTEEFDLMAENQVVEVIGVSTNGKQVEYRIRAVDSETAISIKERVLMSYAIPYKEGDSVGEVEPMLRGSW